MKGLLADFRHALRVYRRTPVASLIAVGMLAVGMAFVGAFLSLYLDQVLSPNPGYEDSGRLVTLGQSDGTRFGGLTYGLIERMNDEAPALDAVAGVQTDSFQGPDGEQAIIDLVTKGYFSGLRPRIALGRGFDSTDHDPESEPVVVVSNRYWRDKLDADPGAVGTTIELAARPGGIYFGPNGERQEREAEMLDFRIVGVTAPEVKGAQVDNVSFWLPMERLAEDRYGSFERIRNFTFMTLGRRSAGASVASLVKQINARYVDSTDDLGIQSGFHLDAVPGVVRSIIAYRDTRHQLQLFLVGSILLALVAACNVSLFLLARAPGRRRELAIRMAVGAPVKRLARQLASEAVLLVIVAAALGLIVSTWLSGFLRGLAFLRQARWNDVSLLDWHVIGAVGAFLLLMTLLVSLAPIFGLKRLGIAASSRLVAARASISQRLAGTLQIAIAGAIGAAAIAFGWYLAELAFAYPGYKIRNLYVATFQPNIDTSRNFNAQLENTIVELKRRREAIEALPGVSAAAFGSPVPGTSSGTITFSTPSPFDANKPLQIQLGTLDSHFIDILGLTLLSGRLPTDSDGPVGVVNQALARAYWGREDVVGESLPFAVVGGQRTEIIGVLKDVSFGHPAADVRPMMFVSSLPTFFFSAAAVIESTRPAAELERAIQALIDDGGLELKVGRVAPIRVLRREVIAADRARGLLTIFTAALVVALAALGFYGTQRYLVTAGRREYAIRASLGAGPRALGRLVLGRGLVLGVPGLAVGTLLAFLVVAYLRDDFVSRGESPGLVALAVLVGLVLLLLASSFGPARRARRTQPAPLLREE